MKPKSPSIYRFELSQCAVVLQKNTAQYTNPTTNNNNYNNANNNNHQLLQLSKTFESLSVANKYLASHCCSPLYFPV